VAAAWRSGFYLVSHSADSVVAESFKTKLGLYLRWSVALTILFVMTYGFTNWLAERRTARFHLYFDWELAIPFIPWMIWIYLSLQPFFALPLFVLDTSGISRFGWTIALATLAAGAIHLILPADLGWHRPAAVAGYPVFERFFSLDRPHNMVPSLHVTYSALAFLVIWTSTSKTWLKRVAALWTLLLICSVFLVHQHHLADTVSGLALAALCFRWFKAGRKVA
jgi:membrane-associated phospholipid phosphatase